MTCKTDKCDKPRRARGLCSTCYNRWHRRNNREMHRERDKRYYWSDPEKYRAKGREKYWRDPEKQRERSRRYRAALTEEELERHNIQNRERMRTAWRRMTPEQRAAKMKRDAEYRRRRRAREKQERLAQLNAQLATKRHESDLSSPREAAPAAVCGCDPPGELRWGECSLCLLPPR